MSTAILAAYIDTLTVWYPPKDVLDSVRNNLGEFNHLILAFWLPNGATDVAQAWSNGTFPQDAAEKLHDAGTKVLVSAGGATLEPITAWLTGSGSDGATFGRAVAAFAQNNDLDGIDFDLEDPAYQSNPEKAIEWTVAATQAAKEAFPGAIISHAPQAPYFDPVFGNGPYLSIDQQVGDLIDFYNIQFYNQQTTSYDSFDTLFIQANGWSPDSAVQQIHEAGIPYERIVVGKPLLTSDATNTGWVSAPNLAQWLSQARAQGITPAGVMTWQFHSDQCSAEWSRTVAAGLQS